MEHWILDEAVSGCMRCNMEFTITERKHHCRDCGKIFCSRYSFYLHYYCKNRLNFVTLLSSIVMYMRCCIMRIVGFTNFLCLLFASRCSDHQIEIERLKINKKVRVCIDCHDKIKQQLQGIA